MKLKDSLSLWLRSKYTRGKNSAGRVGNFDQTASESDRAVKKRNLFNFFDSKCWKKQSPIIMNDNAGVSAWIFRIPEVVFSSCRQNNTKIAEINAQIEAQERAIAAAQAQARAQASLAAAASSANNDNDTSTYETAMANARAAAATRERNISAGLGAQTKKGSLAGSKSGYFD